VPVVYSLYDPRGPTSLRIRLFYNLSYSYNRALKPPYTKYLSIYPLPALGIYKYFSTSIASSLYLLSLLGLIIF
jgi:hypothetical protein